MSMIRMSLLFNTQKKNEKALLKFDWSFVAFEASTSLLAKFVIIWIKADCRDISRAFS